MSRLPVPRRRALTALIATAVVALLAVACGGGDGKLVVDGAFAKDKGVPTLAVPTTLADAKGKPCKPATGGKKVKGKPTVEMPKGVPPTKLEQQDLKVGTGTVAKLGDTVKVQYVGIACSSGKQFDASWDQGKPVDYDLADSGLIKGWTEGIPGMKVGGRRRLVIPGSLAYGAQGREGIAPNETLVFVIDLLGATPTPASTTTTVASGGSTTAPAGGSTTAVTDGTSTSAPTTTAGSGPTTVPGSSTTGPTTTSP